MEHVEREDAAAAVVDVVRVAVVRRAHRHDRAEPGRAQSRDLERVEPAPRDAPHADVPVAPGLLPDPADDLQGVVLLLLGVLVGEAAVAFAGTAHVDADGGVAEAGDVRLAPRVAHCRAVALPVREVLEDRRNRVGLGVVGEPDAGGDARPVGEVEPGVLDLPYAARELGADDRHYAMRSVTDSSTSRSRL